MLQANINRSKPSLNLLINQSRELGAGILLVSEPNFIPTADNWFVSEDGSAAIFTDPSYTRMKTFLAKKGPQFMGVHCGPYLIVSIYIFPRLGPREFNSILDDVSTFLAYRTEKIIIGGDFNAKASL